MTHLFILLAALSTFVSSPDELWREGEATLTDRPSGMVACVALSPVAGYNDAPRTFKGWGTTFNERDYDALMMLSERDRNAVLDMAFSREGELRFTKGRLSMNANDYSRAWYGCSEVEGDFENKFFNIEHDKTNAFVYAKWALQRCPGMRFFVSPWSPPAWMKINKDYCVLSSKYNRQPKEKDALLYSGASDAVDPNEMWLQGRRRRVFPRQLATQDYFIQEPRYLACYADQFVKFIDLCAAEGLTVEKVMYQNEAYSYTPYPGCPWTAEGTVRFNVQYLAPALKASHPEVALWLGTINTNRRNYIDQILGAAGMSACVAGIGFQWEGLDIAEFICTKHLKPFICSEAECGNGRMDWSAGRHTFWLICKNLRYGAEEWYNWNYILADDGCSAWGWRQNALIQVDSKTRQVRYTPEYYAVRHYTRAIAPGAVQIGSFLDAHACDGVVYANPDGSVGIVAGNFGAETQRLSVKTPKGFVNFSIRPNTFLSTVIQPDEAYLFSYFRGEASGLHLAWSVDGKTWTPLNGDRPLLKPMIGKDKLMRDPSICRGRDGTYHLVWTSGWKDRFIGYASSRDLVHWSEQRQLDVMPDEPETRNCWAPEVTYDAEQDLFYIYWASTVTGKHRPIRDMDKKEAGLNHRIYLTTTRDFKTFSKTVRWFDPDFSAIDAALVRDEVRKDWIFFVKNENHTPVEKNIRFLRLNALATNALPTAVSAPITPNWSEGPSPLFVGDALYLYFDRYRAGCYGTVCSTDHGETWKDVSSEVHLPEGIRHGTAFTISREELARLRAWDQGGSKAESKVGVAGPQDVSLLEIMMSAEKRVYYGQRVRLSGEIRERVRIADAEQIVLGDYHGQAIVMLPQSSPRLDVGASIRVTGTLTYRLPDGGEVRLVVDEPKDIEIVKDAPWWIPRRVFIGVGVLVAFLLVSLAWAFVLRHQKRTEARVNDAVEKERLRLAHDLHDGYQQLLAGCMFRLTAARTLFERGRAKGGNGDAVLEQLDGLHSSLTHAQDELRAALWTMKEESEGPAAMADLFRYAAARLPQWKGIVSFSTEGEEHAIDRQYAGALLMILQEAVGNALRHGHATSVKVRFVFGRRGFAMLVKDNGCGFDVAAAHAAEDGAHLGIASMRSRMANIGGRFAVTSVVGKGTEVKVVLGGFV